MILLRSTVYFFVMVVSVAVFGLLIALFGWFLPGGFSDRMATLWGRMNVVAQRWICKLDYRIEGADNIPRTGACIIMSKHQSTWETIALRGLLRPDQSWVLKKELMNLPVFGWGLRLARSIPIDRSAGRRAVLKVVEDGLRRLDEQRCVIIFPEGTRTAPGERSKYGIGGGVLAERSSVPVIPIAHNAGVFWRRRGVKKFPGTIHVVIGKPISSTGKKASAIMNEVEEWIEARQEALPLIRENM